MLMFFLLVAAGVIAGGAVGKTAVTGGIDAVTGVGVGSAIIKY